MRIYSMCGTDFIKGKVFPMGAVVVELDNKVKLVSVKFNQPCKEKLFTYVWNPATKKWGTALMQNEYSRMMWRFYHDLHKPSRTYDGNYEEMMRHDRKRKYGTGGVRLRKWTGDITDYECTKVPMHDFRRVWN